MGRPRDWARVSRGEVWLFPFRSPDKMRPVVILSRQGTIPRLSTVVVAPITSTIRGLPSEVPVGEPEGLKHPSVVNLDHLYTVPQSQLKQYIGQLREATMELVCRALAVSLGCDRPGSPPDVRHLDLP